MISLNRFIAPLRYCGLATGLFGIPVFAGLFLGNGQGSWVIMLVTFVTLLFLLLVFVGCLRLWKRKKGKELSNMLRKDAGSVEISGIESIRSNFEEGVEKLRKANKNVYDLPWFLLAGQAGAGKTEAIRRSHAKEDFPAGLNDLMQGVGGTLNMNWWFTNKGIILDTAGRIFEEKVQSGQNNEWQEFLKILKKARKNMPINGFILAISADSLIRDDFSVIEEKASHIAEQITLVQNVLGVRFPVFIMVTKSDFIPGFREFVENINEPNLQQQMLGWSNPKGLDEPFEPEQVDQYLDGVIAKLKKRRLTYLLDPRPQASKRLDDLDALFTFPNQLRAAIPNLRRYIEIVFSLNPWSQKPLFIRGIYFTSSLQQGDALDEAIAEVMGKNLKEMTLSSFMKETPLFLRDVFFRKIYRESGLVTSAGTVKGAMRRRTIIFACACFLGISAVLAAAWFGSRAFRSGVGDEYAHWKFAAGEYSDSAFQPGHLDWQRPIVYGTGINDAFDSEKNVSFEVSGLIYTLPTYLEQMATFTSSEFEIPAVFKPLKFFDDMLTGDSLDRNLAFRTLYEDAVVLPILSNSREKLRAATSESWSARDASGLRVLVQMQVLLNQVERAEGYSRDFWKQLDALYFYLTEGHLGAELEKVYHEFYTDSYLAESGWPNETFSKHYISAADLEDGGLSSIAHGLNLWMNEVGGIRTQQEANMRQLVGVLHALEGVGQLEDGLLTATVVNRQVDSEAVADLGVAYVEVVESIQHLVDGGKDFTFTAYHFEQINSAKAGVETRVRDLNSGLNGTAAGGDALSLAILGRVNQKSSELIESFDQIADPELLRRFEAADQDHLDQLNGIEARLSFYRELVAFRQKLQNANLVKWSEGDVLLLNLRGLHQAVVAPLDHYRGHQQLNLEKLQALADGEMSQVRTLLFKDYKRLLAADLKQLIGFPVFADSSQMMTQSRLAALGPQLGQVSDHINQFRSEMQGMHDQEFDLMLSSLSQVRAFIESAFAPQSIQGSVRVGLSPVSALSSGSLKNTIVWRARLVQLGETGKPARIGRQVQDLGEIFLTSEDMSVLFTSTIGGAPGDVARVRVLGRWAPLQFLLSQKDNMEALGNGKYTFQGQLKFTTGQSLGYGLSLQFPSSIPSPFKWLKTSDLKGF